MGEGVVLGNIMMFAKTLLTGPRTEMMTCSSGYVKTFDLMSKLLKLREGGQVWQ